MLEADRGYLLGRSVPRGVGVGDPPTNPYLHFRGPAGSDESIQPGDNVQPYVGHTGAKWGSTTTADRGYLLGRSDFFTPPNCATRELDPDERNP